MTELRTNMHFRKYDRMGQIRAKGGLSLAIEQVGDQVTVAVAQCSRKDLFNRKLGRTIAEGRLNLAKANAARGRDIEWTGAVADEGDTVREQTIYHLVLPEATNLKSFITEQPFVKKRVAKLLAGGK